MRTILSYILWILLLTLPGLSQAQVIPINGDKVFFFATNGCIPTPITCEGTFSQPWFDLTLAYQYVQKNYKLESGKVIFQLADGTYDGQAMSATGRISGVNTPSQFIVQGNLTNPENVVIMPHGTRASFEVNYGAQLFIRGLKMDHELTKQDMIIIGQYATVWVERLEFGYNFNPYNHMTVAFFSYLEVKQGDYKISGGAQCHVLVGNTGSVYFETNGSRRSNGTFLINEEIVPDKFGKTPDFLAGFFYAASNSSINAQAIGFKGMATGRKFVVEGNSSLDIGGTSPCEVPGTQPGIRRTGGQLLTHPGSFVEIP